MRIGSASASCTSYAAGLDAASTPACVCSSPGSRKERHEGDVLGLSQSGRAITLRFLSLSEHLDVILTAREFCESLYEQDPDNRGMALLAAQFTETERVEYLDKS